MATPRHIVDPDGFFWQLPPHSQRKKIWIGKLQVLQHHETFHFDVHEPTSDTHCT